MKYISLLILLFLSSFSKSAEMKKIYISKVIDHPALNETARGIVDFLIESDYLQGKNIDLRIDSTQGSSLLAMQIATKFVSYHPDVVVGIGTISAQGFIRAIQGTDIKLVFSSITDPVSAGLVSGIDSTRGNITGVSNFVDLTPQLEIFKKVQPNLKNLGFIYNPSEANSRAILTRLEAICPEFGIKLVKISASKTSEVPQAASAAVNKIDAFFISNDNTALSALATIINVANQNQKPVYVSDIDTVEQGALIALGPNQYDLGKQTGKMIVRLLKGEDISNIPVEYPVKTELVINLKAADKIGIKIPESVLKRATTAVR